MKIIYYCILFALCFSCTKSPSKTESNIGTFNRKIFEFRSYQSKESGEELLELSTNSFYKEDIIDLNFFFSGLSQEEVNRIGYIRITNRNLEKLIDFSRFENLEKLTLSFNKIASLELLDFSSTLKYLSLANNIKLRKLEINGNYRKVISFDAMKCSIQRIEGFQNFISLQYLDLRQNPIENIEEVLSIPNSSILEITLSIVHGLEINRVDAFLRNALVKFGKFDITIDDRGNLTDESTMYNIREENDIKRFINAYEKIAG